MRLSEKIAELQGVLERYGDLECIYSSDDEGNEFHPVNHGGFVWVEKKDQLPYYVNEIVCDEDMDDEIEYVKVYCIN